MKIKDLVAKVLEKDTRGIAKAITCVENEMKGYKKILRKLKKHLGNAHIIGVTGFPGAGKSTLVGCLINEYLESDKSIGVVAVDPSSLSGGSILGDRVKMNIRNEPNSIDKKLFIRSMPSQGHHGGLAKGTGYAVNVLDAAGYDKIIVETVGAGQSDIDIMNLAHTSILIVNPGFGDIQTIKGGIMEIADIYVVNKADKPGADMTEMEINSAQSLSLRRKDWIPQVYKTQADCGKGIKELIEGIESHFDYLKKK